MLIPRPSADDGTAHVSPAWRGLFKLILTLAFAIGTFLAGSLKLSAADGEPLYYIYHGQQKQLILDDSHIAVRVRANAADRIPVGLMSRGYTVADVESRPLSDWIVIRAHGAATGARLNSQPGTNSARENAAAVHDLIRSLSATGDPEVDFVSPVFRDKNGNPVLLTSRLLIGFSNDLPAAERGRLQSTIPEGSYTEQTAFPQPNDQRWKIRTNDGFAALARANALAQTPGVTYAEPDMIVTGHHNLVPSDPLYSQSWGLRTLNGPAAWDITLGSPSVIVVIFDCGIQQDHPDLNQVPGKDFTSDQFQNPSGGPFGSNDDHGTLVAGCVSELINNGIGTAGLAPGCKVASARVGTNVDTNGTFTFQFSWLVDALSWAQTIGARVTNNSNGYSLTSGAIDSAYTNAHAAGIVHFAAAGNQGNGAIDYPASSPNVNAVGSINSSGSLSAFSNFGPGLKFVAPGEQILTTDRTGRAGLVNGDYTTVTGTSFSSPYTAAVAALVISIHPTWTADQVEQQMQLTCHDNGAPGYDTLFGYGIPDAFNALTFVAPPPTPTPTATPTPTPTATPEPTATPINTPTPTPGETPTPTPIESPTPTPIPTPTPTATPSPTAGGTTSPTATPYPTITPTFDDWSNFQHDLAHSGRSSASIDPSSAQFSWRVSGYVNPLIVGNTLYASGGGAGFPVVTSFNLTTGAINWSYPSSSSLIWSPAAVGGGFVVFAAQTTNQGDYYCSLYVLDAATGQFRYAVPLTLTFPRVSAAVVRDSNGAVTAYIEDGNKLSAVSLGGSHGSVLWTDESGYGGYSIPTLVETSLVLAAPDQYYTVDRSTGATNHFHVGTIGGGGGCTATYDTVRKQFYIMEYFGGVNQALSAYRYTDYSHVTLLWQRTDMTFFTGESVAIGPNGYVYVGASNMLWELDPDTGATRRFIPGPFSSSTPPIISAGILWTCNPTQVLAFDLETLALLRVFDQASTGTLESAKVAALTSHHIVILEAPYTVIPTLAVFAIGGSAIPTPTPSAFPTATPTPTPASGGTPVVPPTVTIATFAPQIWESGDGQIVFNAVPANSNQPTVVNYSMSGKATYGLDFTVDGIPGQAVIPAGASSVVVTLHALFDTVKERGEKVTFTLQPGAGYNLSRNKKSKKATVTIVNQGGS